MIDEFGKQYLHDDLRWTREALLSKLEGLSEYDVRRPLTTTGTNLLSLVKHLSVTEARYFSEVFDRPSPWPLPDWKSCMGATRRTGTAFAPGSSAPRPLGGAGVHPVASAPIR